MNSVSHYTNLEGKSADNIIPFVFHGITLRESCWINGVPHFTRRAIGEFLEYKFPEQAITKIIERNPYISEFRIVVNLTTIDYKRNVGRPADFFNPIGLQCIFFESHQPKAIQYKIAVAQLVWAMANGTLKPSKWSQKGDLVSAARQILSLPEGRKRSDLVADLTKSEGCSRQHIYRRIAAATGERLKTSKGLPRKPRSEKGSTKYPGEREKVLSFIKKHPEYLKKGNQHRNFQKKDIVDLLELSVSASRMCAWIREAEKCL